MANKFNEIGDIVKKAKILLLDIEGTTTSISFVKDKLFPYAEENVQKFLEGQWETAEVKEAVSALRKQAAEDQEKNVEGAVKIPGEDVTKEEQVEGLVANVKWQMAADRKAGPLKQLQGLIWKQGYDNGDIKGHVYDDVSPALELWRSVEGQKVYIYSSGSVQAQKLLFAQSSSGDLLKFIDGHFDTAVGAKQEADSYKKIVAEIGCEAEEILFLTDILKEAEAARDAGLHAALLTREGNTPLPDDVSTSYPVLRSFSQLTVSNKRKPDTQDEPEQPAKVPKTETETEVKVASIEETSAKPETVKMEVEDEAVTEKTEEPKVDEPMQSGPVIEEVTDSSEPVDAPVCTTEPIVEEKHEETETKTEETEKMDTAVESTEPQKENITAEAPVAEETPPKVITEIKDVTDDKIEEVPEITEDIAPIVEEPHTDEADMAELQNAGEVLEKECDEILSKVQDVTNLVSIAVKPMLNTISEENMETENLDTNDIVERILDSELELEAEMKQCEDIDLNTVTEVAEEDKTEVTKEEVKEETAEPISAEKIDDTKPEATTPEDTKLEDTKSEDTKSEDTKPEDTKPEDTKSEDTKPEETKPEETKEEESSPIESTEPTETPKVVEETAQIPETKPEEQSETVEKEKPTETKSDEPTVAEEKTPEPKPEEPKLNGNATNGNGNALNGDASPDEDVNSRLAAENGKEVVNGANGKTNGSDEVKDEKVEPEVTDIKVKSVAAAETRTDPIDQATEA